MSIDGTQLSSKNASLFTRFARWCSRAAGMHQRKTLLFVETLGEARQPRDDALGVLQLDVRMAEVLAGHA